MKRTLVSCAALAAATALLASCSAVPEAGADVAAASAEPSVPAFETLMQDLAAGVDVEIKL